MQKDEKKKQKKVYKKEDFVYFLNPCVCINIIYVLDLMIKNYFISDYNLQWKTNLILIINYNKINRDER